MALHAIFLAVAAAATGTRTAGAALHDVLSQSVFFDSGTVYASDEFSYIQLYCGYLEAENVSSVNSSWGSGCSYLIYKNESGSLGPCSPTSSPPT